VASPSRVGQNAAANVLQVLFGAVLLLGLYRLVNETLGPSGLGVWSVVVASASVTRVTELGLGASVTRFVARYLARSEGLTAARIVETVSLSLMAIQGVILPMLYWPLWEILRHLFNGEHLASARALLPFALGSLWLAVVSAVFQSALDGCQRMADRAKLVIAGQLVLIAFASILIPTYGLVGLALAQIAQGTFLLLSGWWTLKRHMRELPRFPSRWSNRLFREILGYGANVQASTFVMLFFDPLTKALLAKFGGPSIAGYFEIANQVVLRVRGIIIAANQAIVPQVAEIAETDSTRLPGYYRQNIRTLVFVALPAFSLVVAWSGVVSWLFLGYSNLELLFLLGLCSVAWFLNILAAPAYFMNQGTGRVGLNTISHVIMGILNGALGWGLGVLLGSDGVAWAYGVALAAGSWLLIIAFQLRGNIHLKDLRLFEHRWLAVSSVTLGLFGYWSWHANFGGAYFWLLLSGLHMLLIATVWCHPLRAELSANLSHSAASRRA